MVCCVERTIQMERLLFVDCCLRGEGSRTLKLCRAWLDRYRALTPDCQIQRVELARLGLTPLATEELEQRDRLVAAGALEHPLLALAAQFAAADRILVGAPYWDLSFPSALKVYLERVCVCGVTFHYTSTGSEGLCRAKELTYLTTAGGFIGQRNFGLDYVAGLADFLGITTTRFACAQGLDIQGMDVDALMTQALHETLALLP